ncbi:MAG: RDD family protein [Actinobacteria bacterium]|nr:RDD family protein [Actinomycetota bacterium]
MTNPPAGWYPDPAGGTGKRYWNGSQWTSQVSPPPVRPAPQPPVASQEPTQPAEPPPSATPTPPVPPSAAEPAPPVNQEPEPPVGEQPPPGQPPQVGWPAATPAPGQSQPAGSYPPAGGPGTTPYNWGQAAPAVTAAGAGDPRVVWGPDGQMLSGWWRRAGGYLIDSLGIGIITVVVVVIVGALSGAFNDLVQTDKWDELLEKIESNPGYQPSVEEFMDLFGSGFVTLFVVALITSLILSIINGVILVARSGQTVGDRIVSIRKVTAGRQPPTMGVAFIRWLIPNGLGWLGNIPFLGIAFSMAVILDYLWPLWDTQNRTWQDMAAKTWVERADVAGPIPERSSPYPNN